jgi:hypothetical protein
VAGFCKRGNETSFYVKALSFLGQLNKYERSERPRTVDLGVSISLVLRGRKSSAMLYQRRLPNVV